MAFLWALIIVSLRVFPSSKLRDSYTGTDAGSLKRDGSGFVRGGFPPDLASSPRCDIFGWQERIMGELDGIFEEVRAEVKVSATEMPDLEVRKGWRTCVSLNLCLDGVLLRGVWAF